MKIQLHGFISVNQLVDNTLHVDSPIGELSSLGRTYAKDKGYYTNQQWPGVRLVVFRYKQDDRNAVVPTYISDLILNIGSWVAQQAQSGGIGRNNATNRQAIAAEFATRISQLKLGRIIQNKNLYLPQYLEFKINPDSDPHLHEGDDTFVKVWLSDPAFRQQYPYYEIEVIAPIENLDDFFTDANGVRRIRNNIVLSALHDKVNQIKERYPYTMIKSYEYEWNDPTNEETKIPIPWTVLIYGGIGENLDLIRLALQEFILSHSSRDRSEWQRIFPDLFVPTEYIIAPYWTMPSVPGYRTISSMYSPMVRYKDVYAFAKEAIKTYEDSHLRQYVEIGSSLYKSISFLVCGNKLNRLAPISFYSKYPQYALIPSRTDDFNRMDVDHQNMIHILHKLFLAAETADPDTELDLSLTKITRDGVMYISTTYQNIQYLMVAKWNYTSGALTGVRP